MSESNLGELRKALEHKGWRIVAEHPGNEYEISASWEIGRNRGRLFIDFLGLDDLRTLPLEKSYGCRLRGRIGTTLHFRKIGLKGSRRRSLWTRDLSDFVKALETR